MRRVAVLLSAVLLVACGDESPESTQPVSTDASAAAQSADANAAGAGSPAPASGAGPDAAAQASAGSDELMPLSQLVPVETADPPGSVAPPTARSGQRSRVAAAEAGGSVTRTGGSDASQGGAGQGLAGREHTIARGETLATIARRHNLSASDIAAWNGIDDPRRLQIGQKLRLSPPG